MMSYQLNRINFSRIKQATELCRVLNLSFLGIFELENATYDNSDCHAFGHKLVSGLPKLVSPE